MIFIILLKGCKKRHWREFILYNWNLLYENMVYRELLIEKTSNHELNLETEKRVEDGFNNFLKVYKYY